MVLQPAGEIAEERPKHGVKLSSGQATVAWSVIHLTQHDEEIREGQQCLIRRTSGSGNFSGQAFGQYFDADQPPQSPFERLSPPNRALKICSNLGKNARPPPYAVKEGCLQIVATERVKVDGGC